MQIKKGRIWRRLTGHPWIDMGEVHLKIVCKVFCKLKKLEERINNKKKNCLKFNWWISIWIFSILNSLNFALEYIEFGFQLDLLWIISK